MINNKAPNIIYLQYANGEDLPVTWAVDAIYESDVQYTRSDIIEDLKSISDDHVSYLKVLSEKDQQIEDMKTDIQKFIEDYSGDDLTGALVYWLNHWGG